MKAEFNKNGMYAEINVTSEPSEAEIALSSFKFLGEQVTLLLGILAMFTASANLLFGLIAKIMINTAGGVAGNIPWHIVTVMVVISCVLAAISVVCGVVSIIKYTNSARKTGETIGFALSVISFVVCFAGLVINILSLFV